MVTAVLCVIAAAIQPLAQASIPTAVMGHTATPPFGLCKSAVQGVRRRARLPVVGMSARFGG